MIRDVFLLTGNFYGKTNEKVRSTAFYAAVFDAWNKNALIAREGNFQPALGDVIRQKSGTSAEEETKAERVKTALKSIDGAALAEIGRILLAAAYDREQIAYRYVKEIFRDRAPARDKIYLPAVRDAVDEIKKTSREIERLKGFLRFKETTTGVYYAACSPDNDIVFLLAPHFIKRLRQPFLIHDVSRGYAAGFDGKNFRELPLKNADVFLCDDERLCSALWKEYFNSIAVRARKNERQQDLYMPRRYRPFIDETQP